MGLIIVQPLSSNSSGACLQTLGTCTEYLLGARTSGRSGTIVSRVRICLSAETPYSITYGTFAYTLGYTLAKYDHRGRFRQSAM